MQRRCGPAQPARTGRGAGPTSYMFILIILPKSCRCPQPDCKAGISVDAVRGLLSRREWGAVLDVAAEASLPAEEKIYCPYAECSALLVMGPDFGRAGDSACPHCNKCAFMTWICSEFMCAAGHGTQLWQSRQHREPALREVRLDVSLKHHFCAESYRAAGHGTGFRQGREHHLPALRKVHIFSRVTQVLRYVSA